MHDTIQRIRKARQGRVTVGKYTFLFKRPTDVDAGRLYRTNATIFDIAREFVIGWENVLDSDIALNGADEPVKFDGELWQEWLSDNPDFWVPIRDAVMDAYEKHVTKRADAEKNS